MSLRKRIIQNEDEVVRQEEEAEMPILQEPAPDVHPSYESYTSEQLEQMSGHVSEQSPEIHPVLDRSPLAILDEVKHNPSPKGSYPTIIGGRPVDLHDLEDYLLKISPYSLKTIMRYHQARTIEELRRYSKGKGSTFNMKIIWIILMIIGMIGLGIFVILFLPQIMGGMKNMIPGAGALTQ